MNILQKTIANIIIAPFYLMFVFVFLGIGIVWVFYLFWEILGKFGK